MIAPELKLHNARRGATFDALAILNHGKNAPTNLMLLPSRLFEREAVPRFDGADRQNLHAAVTLIDALDRTQQHAALRSVRGFEMLEPFDRDRNLRDRAGRAHPCERELDQREDVPVEERLPPGEVDVLHPEALRVADRRAHVFALEGPEPRIDRTARVDAVGAREVAPRPGDLHPERGEAAERRRGGRERLGRGPLGTKRPGADRRSRLNLHAAPEQPEVTAPQRELPVVAARWLEPERAPCRQFRLQLQEQLDLVHGEVFPCA